MLAVTLGVAQPWEATVESRELVTDKLGQAAVSRLSPDSEVHRKRQP